MPNAKPAIIIRVNFLSGLWEPATLQSTQAVLPRHKRGMHNSHRQAHTNGHRTDSRQPWERQVLPSQPHASPRVYESARVRLKRQRVQGSVTLDCSKKM